MIAVETPKITRSTDYHAVLDAYACQHGLTGYICLADKGRHAPAALGSEPQLRFVSPSANHLIQLYHTRNLAAFDPVERYVEKCGQPVIWTSKEFKKSDDPRQRELFQLVEEEGFKSGISIPYYGPLNVYGRFVVLDVAEKIEMERAIGEIRKIMPFAVPLVTRAISDGAIDEESLLTRRELDCLDWVGKGKTSWEIGKILGIKPRTVDFHINNAIAKLDATSRNQALYEAMRMGLLPLIDPCDFRGAPPSRSRN